MANSPLTKTDEIDRNLARFLELLPTLVSEREGQYALMRHQRIIDFYDSAIEAQMAGNNAFDTSSPQG